MKLCKCRQLQNHSITLVKIRRSVSCILMDTKAANIYSYFKTMGSVIELDIYDLRVPGIACLPQGQTPHSYLMLLQRVDGGVERHTHTAGTMVFTVAAIVAMRASRGPLFRCKCSPCAWLDACSSPRSQTPTHQYSILWFGSSLLMFLTRLTAAQ